LGLRKEAFARRISGTAGAHLAFAAPLPEIGASSRRTQILVPDPEIRKE